MSTTHTTTFRDLVANLIGDTVDSGKLVFRLSGTANAPGTAVATLTLNAAAFPPSSTGVITAAAITSDTNATGNASPVGTATIETSGGVVKAHCAVAASGSDINMSNGLVIAAGDTVSASSLVYTAMP